MLLRSLSVAALLVSAAAAQDAIIEKPMTQAERDFLVIHLLQSRQTFLKSLEGLTPEQFLFKPADNKWSIAQVAEHLVKTEDLFQGMMQKQILPMKPNNPKRMGRAEDEAVIKRINDRSQKAEAPEPLQPAASLFKDPKMVPDQFNERRNKTVAFVWLTTEDLRVRMTPQKMDAYQMMLLLSAHTERHTAQIQEVKSDPKFPK